MNTTPSHLDGSTIPPSGTHFYQTEPLNPNPGYFTTATYQYPPEPSYDHLHAYVRVIDQLMLIIRDDKMPTKVQESAKEKLKKYLDLL
jgi:hypothetical protein